MKKLIFLFTMVLAVSMAMAQNTANLSQTGTNQNATIGQTGSLNNAKVIQFTNNNGPQKSTVLQNGKRNDVIVEQKQTGGGNNVPANTAFIEQIGNDNYGKQYENAPGYNSSQKVEAHQIGSKNDVRQSIFSGYTESLYTLQTGNENKAVQEATGGGHNHANIYQLGNKNWAKQELFGDNNGYMSADVLIKQNGILNEASQLFRGYGQGHKNNGEIYQTGNGNDAFQEGSGRNLDLRLWQNGNDNESTQKSSGNYFGNRDISWLTQNGNGNTSTIIQDGNDNSTKLNQNGNGGKVDVLQKGNFNIIGGLTAACEIEEWGNVFNLKANQLGERNKLYINSKGTLTVLQENTGTAMIGNVIRYYQSGNGTTNFSQVGDENIAGLLHGGNGNVNIQQAGNDNQVAKFDDVFASDPVLIGCGTFNGVKLDVDQLGNDNLLHLASTGYSDIVTVMQNGSNNRASVTQQP